MEQSLGKGPRFEIDPTAGEVVTATNTLVDAKKSGGESAQKEAMQGLLEVLANRPGAVDVFSAMHGAAEEGQNQR